MSSDLKPPKGANSVENKVPFTDAELERIINACDKIGTIEWQSGTRTGSWSGEDAKDFIWTLRYTGLRISDVALLNIERLQGNELYLRAKKIGGDVFAYLPDWLRDRLQARSKTWGPMLFQVGDSTRVETVTDTWRRKLHQVFLLAGFNDPTKEGSKSKRKTSTVTPHRFRHTFARILLERGVPVSDVADILGDDEDTVRQHYARWVPERQARLTKVLQDAFADKTKPTGTVEQRHALASLNPALRLAMRRRSFSACSCSGVIVGSPPVCMDGGIYKGSLRKPPKTLLKQRTWMGGHRSSYTRWFMTVALAWVGQRKDGLQHLYLASDSRLTGARTDASPKILTLPRSDCALCFAGDTHATYPMMLQIANAIGAHQPARERSLDIARVKDHLLRVLTDLAQRYETPFKKEDIQFIFAGYSWRTKRFRIWTIGYLPEEKRLYEREATTFLPRAQQIAWIGDWAKRVRNATAKELHGEGRPVNLEPLHVLAKFLKNATKEDSIGGAPQLVRISQHMTTRPFCVKWKGTDTLLGRLLFDYENVDYWSIDPYTGEIFLPRKFGHREDDETNGEADASAV